MIESSLRLQVRPATHADLYACVDLLPAWLPLDDHVRARLPAIWTNLLHQPSFNADILEDIGADGGSRLLAMGMSIALCESWQDRLASSPPYCAAAEVYRGLYDGSFAPLSDAELGVLNASGRVAFLVLHYSQRIVDMSDPDTINLLQVAMNAFRTTHSGYRLSRLYQEGVGEELTYMASMGFMPCHPDRTYANDQPVLCGLSYEDALTRLPGTPVRDAFQFTPPVIGFSASERRLLRLAVMDISDERIGDELGLSGNTIKKLWRSIYQRVSDRLPALFADDQGGLQGADMSARGPEKRRVLIPYLRQHPEELRPYRMS